MDTDPYILAMLDWCHRNPITVGLAIPAMWAIVRKTKNTWDDWAMKKLTRAIGHD